MNRVLIIDDQKIKVLRLRDLVLAADPKAEIVVHPHFRPALRRLEHEIWDLVVLDMSFDMFAEASSDAAFEALAGLQVLQDMRRRDIYVPVIIVTAHDSFEDPNHGEFENVDALTQHVFELFPEHCFGVFRFDSSDAVWARQFESLARKILND